MGIAHPPKPHTAQLDGARQFDFWLGEWDCSWAEGGSGTNSVYTDLGDKVIVESFDGRPAMAYQGMSFSVYDRMVGRWKQTWVDSDGNYMTFEGGWENGAMELRRELPGEERPALMRMRWHDIADDAFEWSYERSDDGGQTWSPLWEIGYRRVL